MRVALVTPGFPPEMGGIETYVSNLAIQLDALGLDVDVLTQSARNQTGEQHSNRDARTRIIRFADWTGTDRFRIAPGLWSYLRRYGPTYDIVHAHNFHAFTAPIGAFATNRPLVFSPYYHGGGHTPLARLLHVPYGRLAGRIFARSSAILCLSDAERRLLVNDFPETAPRATTVGVGVDVTGIRTAKPFELDHKVLLLMGRLESHKNYQRAIDAFARCKSPAKMVIIGTGPERDAIARKVDELGVAHKVQLLGYVEEPELRRWQRTAHVVMSLSSAESFGLTVAEASAAGATVIASDIPAHRDVAEITKVPFRFVPLGTSAAEIAELLDRELQSDEAPGVTNGLTTWRQIGERVVNAYEHAVVAV